MTVQIENALNSNVSNFDHAGLPSTGFLRLKQFLGDKKTDPPTPAIIPISASSWWDGVKKGIYPAPVKISSNVTAWKVDDIKALIDRINNQGAAV
jgi:prophage regulatory protein